MIRLTRKANTKMQFQIVSRNRRDDFDTPSLMIEIPDDLREQLKEIAKEIPGKYKVKNSWSVCDHISILVNVEDADFERKLAELKLKPVEIELGDYKFFKEPDSSTDDNPYSVLYVEVKSPQLKALYNKIKDAKIKAVDYDGSYKPHITLQYMKPVNLMNRMKAYSGDDYMPESPVPDYTWAADTLTISYEDKKANLPIKLARRSLTSDLQSKIQWLLQNNPEVDEATLQQYAEADPSGAGTYLPWVVKQVQNQQIRLPEDKDKVFNVLKYFNNNKNKKDWPATKDINQLDYYTLQQTIDSLQGVDLKSKQQEVKEVKEQGAKVVYEKDGYSIIEVTTPEAACIYSKETRWCTSDPETASDYLQDGPLHIILKNNKKVAQYHEQSGQLMDVTDAPVDDLTILQVLIDGLYGGNLATAPSSVRRYVAENPGTPPETLKQLGTDDDPDVRLYVAGNTSISPETLNQLSTDDDSLVRRSVAHNTNTPAETLKQLSTDDDPDVRRNLAENTNTPVETLKQLSTDKDKYVRYYVAENTSTPPETLKQLGTDDDPSVRHYVARNTNTPVETLKQLGTDNDPSVRHRVAKNTNTPVETLKQLSTDKDKYVRYHVAENTNTPPEILKQLGTDNDVDVRHDVARNTSTPTETLKQLATDKDRYVRRVAREMLNNRASTKHKLSRRRIIHRKDQLPGGVGDKKEFNEVDQDELNMGIEVELEHTDNKKIAKEIALDHLIEDPKYYTKLKTIHTEGRLFNEQELREAYVKSRKPGDGWLDPKPTLAEAIKRIKSSLKKVKDLLAGDNTSQFTKNYKVHKNFSPMIQDMRMRNERYVAEYNSYDTIAEATDGVYTVVIKDAVTPYGAGKIFYLRNDRPNDPVPAGNWMDFAEAHYPENYDELPKERRAQLEAEEQLNKYIASQYEQAWRHFYDVANYEKEFWDTKQQENPEWFDESGKFLHSSLSRESVKRVRRRKNEKKAVEFNKAVDADYVKIAQYIHMLKSSEGTPAPHRNVIALFKKYNFTYSGIVYRGVRDRGIENKDITSPPGWSSWSTNKEIAKSFIVSNWLTNIGDERFERYLNEQGHGGALLQASITDGLAVDDAFTFLSQRFEDTLPDSSYAYNIAINIPGLWEDEVIAENVTGEIIETYSPQQVVSIRQTARKKFQHFISSTGAKKLKRRALIDVKKAVEKQHSRPTLENAITRVSASTKRAKRVLADETKLKTIHTEGRLFNEQELREAYQKYKKTKKLRRSKKDPINVATPDDLKSAFREVSLHKDDDGYYIKTHRARSKSYSDPHKIPQKDIDFISSTSSLENTIAYVKSSIKRVKEILAKPLGFYIMGIITQQDSVESKKIVNGKIEDHKDIWPGYIGYRRWWYNDDNKQLQLYAGDSDDFVLVENHLFNKYGIEPFKNKSVLSDKTLYEGEYADMVEDEEFGYEYIKSEPGVAILPFRTDKKETPFLGLFERVPAHGDEQPLLHAMTGTIDDDEKPEETAVREFMEEAGYEITKDMLIPLGEVNPAKNSEWRLTMFAVDVTGLEQKEKTTDGTELEEEAYTEWLGADVFLESEDAVLYSLLMKFSLADQAKELLKSIQSSMSQRDWLNMKFDELRQSYGGNCQICGETEQLEFAHLEDTGISGPGRGKKNRYYNIKNNPDSYYLLDKQCHYLRDKQHMSWKDIAKVKLRERGELTPNKPVIDVEAIKAEVAAEDAQEGMAASLRASLKKKTVAWNTAWDTMNVEQLRNVLRSTFKKEASIIVRAEKEPVIYTDVDGTISDYSNGYEKNKWGPPITEMIDMLNRQKEEKGAKIVIWTARGEDEREGLTEWLDSSGLNYGEIIMEKPYFDVLVDDKVVQYKDDVNETAERVEEQIEREGTCKKIKRRSMTPLGDTPLRTDPNPHDGILTTDPEMKRVKLKTRRPRSVPQEFDNGAPKNTYRVD